MNDGVALNDVSLALFVDDDEERSGWLARLFENAGFAVLRERGARQALERASAARPDLIVVAADLPDGAGVELCRALRAAPPGVNAATPIFLVFSEPATREARLTALRAGAWDCVAPPHDADELVLKANVYIQAKREADRTRTEGLLDASTGLYNRQGLARRARELSSQAFREHAAIACVALAIDLPKAGRTEADDDVVGRGVRVLRTTARGSDVIGRLGPAEFAVLAPGTDATGARRLAERLASSLQVALGRSTATELPPSGMRVGYEAVANVGYSPIEPIELLGRAAAALRTGKVEAGGWIRRFDMTGLGGTASAAAG